MNYFQKYIETNFRHIHHPALTHCLFMCTELCACCLTSLAHLHMLFISTYKNPTKQQCIQSKDRLSRNTLSTDFKLSANAEDIQREKNTDCAKASVKKVKDTRVGKTRVDPGAVQVYLAFPRSVIPFSYSSLSVHPGPARKKK